MSGANSLLLLVGRILLAGVFIRYGYHNLFVGGIDGTAAQLTSHGFPEPKILAYAAQGCQLAGGILLFVGFLTRFAAVLLAVYVAALAVIFHNYWAMDPAQLGVQTAFFYYHLSLVGGLLTLAVAGAGKLSIDRG